MQDARLLQSVISPKVAKSHFLQPRQHLEWPIQAVLSDKPTGLVPAVATVLPHSRYQFCQAH